MKDINKEIENKFNLNDIYATQKTNDAIEDTDAGQVDKEEIKIEQEKSLIKPKEEVDLKVEKDIVPTKNFNKDELESLKKALNDAKTWGHQKNKSYVNAKKKMTDFLNRLQDEGLIFEEQATEALGFFNAKDDELIEHDKKENTDSPFIELKGKLDKEFSIFKKYAKIDNAEEKYNAFFYFWPMLSEQEQNETLTYLKEEEPSVVIDTIMNTGSKLQDTVISGINKSGGLVPFIESLKAETLKLEEKNVKLVEKINKLQSELDGTTEKVYSRSLNSKDNRINKPVNNGNILDMIYSGRN